MKTSNKLLIIATVLLFSYLVVYDLQLKAELLNGRYKNPFYGMAFAPLNHFTSIENKAGNIIDLRIEKGKKFGVWTKWNIKDKVGISQHNGILYIYYPGKERVYGSFGGITIICPSVSSVTTLPAKMPDGSFGNRATTSISGFFQDSMRVSAGGSSEIELTRSTLNKFTAATTESNAALIIRSDNTIKDADINMAGKSEFKLFKPFTGKAIYNFTDSTTFTLGGQTFRRFQPKL